jgi:hypothetical protein
MPRTIWAANLFSPAGWGAGWGMVCCSLSRAFRSGSGASDLWANCRISGAGSFPSNAACGLGSSAPRSSAFECSATAKSSGVFSHCASDALRRSSNSSNSEFTKVPERGAINDPMFAAKTYPVIPPRPSDARACLISALENGGRRAQNHERTAEKAASSGLTEFRTVEHLSHVGRPKPAGLTPAWCWFGSAKLASMSSTKRESRASFTTAVSVILVS